MALKNLLGLESFNLTDEEIIHKIKDAQKKRLSEVVFSSAKNKVTVRLTDVDSQGIMRWAFGY
jgi:hypothetical protein